MKRFSIAVIIFILSLVGVLSIRALPFVNGSVVVHAQVTNEDVLRRRAELEAELEKLENEIKTQGVLLESQQKERASLERDIGILDTQIAKAKLAIKQRDLSIQQINGDIGDKLISIGNLSDKLMREKASLAQLIRRTHQIDDVSMVEIFLGTESLADIFEELDSFTQVKSALNDSFREIEDTRAVTEEQKNSLEEKRIEETQLKQIQLLQKQKIEQQEKEKNSILTVTKGKEKVYQEVIKTKEKTAAQIRSELFSLRDSAAIPFGDALAFAQTAGKATDVRPALILGVLKQETRLGEFLGTGTWSVDMHPTRDRPLYLAITSNLGYNPDKMPVSKQPGYGWGGAMGPGQFIPSTWACYGGYINTNTGDCNNSKRSMSWDDFWPGPWEYSASKDRIRKLLGKNSPSDPWKNADAFMATGLLMMENGADGGTYAAERLAALRYFAGWTNATKSAYAFYGDGVMEHATFFQKQIDILSRD